MYQVTAYISNENKVQDLIQAMKEAGFTGASIVDCVGLKRALRKGMDVPLVASINSIFDKQGELNKILFCVVQTLEEVEKLTDIIEHILGDLHQRKTGLVVAHKLDFVRGFDLWERSD